MAHAPSPLFLREPEVRRGLELLHMAQQRLNAATDEALAAHGLGRAHQRALYFIARRPGLTVSELLALLSVTKQSLGRVLTELAGRGLVDQRPGRTDRRQRLLTLTAAGDALERSLFEAVRRRVAAAYADAGPAEVTGFWRVLEGLAGADAVARLAPFDG